MEPRNIDGKKSDPSSNNNHNEIDLEQHGDNNNSNRANVTAEKHEDIERKVQDTAVTTTCRVVVGGDESHDLTTAIRMINDADVLCGRGKASFNHVGNHRFRDMVHAVAVDDFLSAATRCERQRIVHEIIDRIHTTGGRFLLKQQQQGQWHELPQQQTTKEKVGRAMDDAANAVVFKSRRHERGQQQQQVRCRPVHWDEIFPIPMPSSIMSSPPLPHEYSSAVTTSSSSSLPSTDHNHCREEKRLPAASATAAASVSRNSSCSAYDYDKGHHHNNDKRTLQIPSTTTATKTTTATTTTSTPISCRRSYMRGCSFLVLAMPIWLLLLYVIRVQMGQPFWQQKQLPPQDRTTFGVSHQDDHHPTDDISTNHTPVNVVAASNTTTTTTTTRDRV